MSTVAFTRRVQRLLIAGLGFLILWQVATVTGAPRHVQVVFGLYGFVFHVIFAKAYSLVPAYFDSERPNPWLPAVQLPLSTLGVLGLGASTVGAPPIVGTTGATLWLAGVVVFVASIAWTIRGNPTGSETGTGEAKADRRSVDRYANAFVPVVIGYLLAGSYDLFATSVGLPPLIGGGLATTHLLAVGAATLLVIAIGFRLLPRLLVATPPQSLVAVVLPAGALAPVLISSGFPGGQAFRVGAALEALAVVGFAIVVWVLFVRSDRRRIGGYALLAGTTAGVLGVLIGLDFAFRGPTPELAMAHARFNVLGFLGLSIVGVTYHFYPPGAGEFRLSGTRTALATVGLLGGGVVVEVAGLVTGIEVITMLGRLAALVGSVGYAYLILGLLRQRWL